MIPGSRSGSAALSSLDTTRQKSFTAGRLFVRYYLDQSAPTQWVAVGVVSVLPTLTGRRGPHGMMVGVGRSATQAVDDLKSRLSDPSTLPPRLAREAALFRRPRHIYRRRALTRPTTVNTPDMYPVPWALHS